MSEILPALDEEIEAGLDLLLKFDQNVFKGPPWETPLQYRKIVSLQDVEDSGGENWGDRMHRMLRPLKTTCRACSMCELGRSKHEQDGQKFDPHVFSTMVPSKWIVVGQNPGFNECLEGKPFVGDSGVFFNKLIEKGGLSREKFYITNIVKCHTLKNNKPTPHHRERCEPFIMMELRLLRPKLVITLGAPSFEALCPGLVMTPHLGKIVKSEKHGVKVYPLYHPSPRNMADPGRKKRFKQDINKLCKLIRLSERDSD